MKRISEPVGEALEAAGRSEEARTSFRLKRPEDVPERLLLRLPGRAAQRRGHALERVAVVLGPVGGALGNGCSANAQITVEPDVITRQQSVGERGGRRINAIVAVAVQRVTGSGDAPVLTTEDTIDGVLRNLVVRER